MDLWKQDQPPEEPPLILAVSIKDQHGHVDLDAIAERENPTMPKTKLI